MLRQILNPSKWEYRCGGGTGRVGRTIGKPELSREHANIRLSNSPKSSINRPSEPNHRPDCRPWWHSDRHLLSDSIDLLDRWYIQSSISPFQLLPPFPTSALQPLNGVRWAMIKSASCIMRRFP